MPWLPATRYVYGGTGHLINDGTHTYQYDAEGRLISVDNGSTATYLYDALGQRVEKDVGGTYSEYVFNLQGQPVGINNRTNWHEDYIPMGQGRHVAHYAAGAHFMRPDALGTTGIVTSYTGAVEQDELHYPWGQQWTMMGSMKEERYARLQHRDCETSTLPGCATGGLDPTLFRTYSSDQGRWMTPDPASEASASPLSPQSFDRYGYVLGNPTRNFDAYGLQCAGGDSSFASPFPGAIQVNVSAPCPPSNNGLLQLLWAANGASVGAATALMGNYMVGVSNYEAYGGAGPGGVFDTPQNLYSSAPPPQALTPAQAATNYCQQHGQLSFNIPFTQIPVTIGFSATLFGNYGTTNDIALTFPPSAGASLDITVGAPQGPNIPVQVGSGRNLSIGTFLTPSGPRGFSASFGPSVGSPVTFSPQVANACGLKAGGG